MIVLSIWQGRIFKQKERKKIKLIKFNFIHRDILITPKRINYAREKEKDLYESLTTLTNSKQNEIQKLILQAVDEMQETLTDQACSLDITGI
jgi:hypothetical protein